MRIAFLSWEATHAALVGSVGIHVSSLAAAMHALGHELHVFTRAAKGQSLYNNVFGVHYHRCPFDPKPNQVDEMTDSMGPSMTHYFHEAEKRFGPFDLIHAHDWLPLPAALHLASEGAADLAVTFHTTEWGRTGKWPDQGDSARVRDLERAAVQAASAVIAVSLEVRRQIENLYQSPDWKTELVYHGVDLRAFDRQHPDPGQVKSGLDIDPMAPLILFSGRLGFRRGPDLLLQAMPAILANKPDARLVFAGDGDMRLHLANDAARFGIEHAVRFTGPVNDGDLIDLMHACDLVCTPSRVDPFGRITLMAWAASKPVVATPSGTSGEFMLDRTNSVKIEPAAPAIATAVNELFTDFDHLRWMGRNGRVAVETAFTWEKIAGKTLEVYDRRRLLEQ